MNCAVAARVNESGAFEVQIGNLTALLAKIRLAGDATHYTGERSAKNYALFRRCGAKERVTDYRQHSGKEPCASKT